MIRGTPEPEFSVHGCIIQWDSDDPLADVLLATVGEYPRASKDIPDYENLLERMLGSNRIRVWTNEPYSRLTAFAR
jgi:hypothetical protein